MIQTALKCMLSVQTREDFSHNAQQGQTLEGAVPRIVHCTPSPKLQAEKILQAGCTESQWSFQNHYFTYKEGGLLGKKAGGLTSVPKCL